MGQLRSTKNGQVWQTDFIIGVSIFTIAMILFITQMNRIEITTDRSNDLLEEASFISIQLMTEGIPVDWTNETVLQPGIVKNYRINETKWTTFVQMDEPRLRSLLRVHHPFFIFLSDESSCIIKTQGNFGAGSEVEIDEEGGCVTSEDIQIDAQNLVQIKRIALYNEKITTITTYVWD